MLENLALLFKDAIRTGWQDRMDDHGENVRLYREYAEGEHRAELTNEMRKMLRVGDARSGRFNINYADAIIQTMADRLTVTSIDGDNEAASTWAAEVLAANRFDGLQMDLHEAALRDGVTYVMVWYDPQREMVMLSHEEAWDGYTGIIPIWSKDYRRLVAAVKVWYEGELDQRRVNIYYEDGVAKYRTDALGAGLTVIEPEDGEERLWLDRGGAPIGVPIIPLVNGRLSDLGLGRSELANMTGMQDALNRTLVSMIMTGELTGFPVRYIIGAEAPAAMTPGMWINPGNGAAVPSDQKVEIGVMEQGQIVPFIEQANFLIDQIGEISRTPWSKNMGAGTASGEALKQRETKLLGKVRRYQVRIGNGFEDMMAMAARVQSVFGRAAPPPSMRWDCKWAEAEMRNDGEVVDNAVKMAEIWGEEQTLRAVAGVFGLDEDAIQTILERRNVEATRRLTQLMAGTQQFDQFASL